MIGIDLVENSKILKALKNDGFINKILTENEQAYVNQFKNRVEHIAGFFSAKEAVMKALENCKKISFKDIEINHEKSGKPYVKLMGEAKIVFSECGYKGVEISISQTENFATAVAILIK